MNSFVEGMIAGYGIAIPVGAIAVLIIETALRGGFMPGFAAGAGAASADFVYALVVVIAGSVVAGWLAPIAPALRIASAAVLLGLGGWGLWRSARAVRTDRSGEGGDNAPQVAIEPTGRIYLTFLGLTLLNPATFAYFAAIILGGGAGGLDTLAARGLFIAGAGIASLSWQTLLAAIGALAHRHLSPMFRLLTGVVGNLVVIGLGVRM